eukprot:SAG31_NODE_21656_length_544_cov_0.849438_1_plen_21_part_10
MAATVVHLHHLQLVGQDMATA